MKKLLNNLHTPLLIFTFLCMIHTIILHSQNDTTNPYALFDQVIGKTNSGIYNGTQYFEKFQVKNDKHKFFKHKFFIWGSFTYNNQPYFETALKYDVYSDELLIKNSEILDASITQLDKKNVSEFELNGHLFKNLNFSINQEEFISGYFEILLENNTVSVFKKHRKQISRIVDKEVYYEFKDQYRYYISYKNRYYLLKKVSLLTTVFPEHKTHLKNSFKRYENLKKTDTDEHLKSIIGDLNKQILNGN